jgi:hypothetical protein
VFTNSEVVHKSENDFLNKLLHVNVFSSVDDTESNAAPKKPMTSDAMITYIKQNTSPVFVHNSININANPNSAILPTNVQSV